MKQIYLAGGCFWGIEKYLSLIPGVTSTGVGYANGRTENPTYEEVCRHNTGHAETVCVEYNPEMLGLPFLLELFFEVIDPTSINQQGADVGEQYRTGIYYVDAVDQDAIVKSIAGLQNRLAKPVAVEVKPLDHYYPAEEYHQKYLDKNPGGYCHVPAAKMDAVRHAIEDKMKYRPKSKDELHHILNERQFDVTQNSATEPPFQNEYYDHFEPGIYVDVTTGEPLFVSSDKFESGCGWPSFSKPISDELIQECSDLSLGVARTEVRSKHGNAHLGHVFADGPKNRGGLRYCINSASLRFVPEGRMQAEGYGGLIGLVSHAGKR